MIVILTKEGDILGEILLLLEEPVQLSFVSAVTNIVFRSRKNS